MLSWSENDSAWIGIWYIYPDSWRKRHDKTLRLLWTHHDDRKISLAVLDGFVDEVLVLGHDGGLVDERRVGRGILWLETTDSLDVARIGNDCVCVCVYR